MADELIFRLTVEDAGSATLGAFERKLKGLETDAKTLSGSMKTAFGNVGGYIVNFASDAAREFAKFSKESVDAFLQFENAMVAVAKTTGIPKEQLGKFSEQIRETAVNLKGLGKDAAVQIANVAEVAGQLGIASDKLAKGDFEAASQEILGFSTVIAKAKIALPEFTGGVEEIATVIAKQIQLYGETPAAAEQYLSVMNKLSDTTAATAKDIAGFLKNFTMAPTLKIMQEESAAWGATFVSLGQNAYDAATRMQSAYSQVLAGSKDTNVALNNLFLGNKKMADQLLDLTGKVREFSTNGKQDITSYANLAREAIGIDANEAMKLFVTTLSEVESSSERASLATAMFGRVGGKAILTLIPELPKLSDAAKEAATVFLSTNEQALDSLAKMSGVSRKEFSDNADFMAAVYKKDMPDAIRVLVTEINKIDDEQEKARVASEVFGEDWEVAMNKAEGGVKLFDEALQTAQKEIEATKNGASSIEKEYATALDKVGTSFSELTAITDDIKLQWGAPLAEALSAGIKLMIPVIDELRKNFMGVVEEFGRELGGESLASAFRQTATAFSGVIEEMGADAEGFVQTLAEQFTLPNLFATAMSQWSAFAVWLGDSAAGLAKSVASTLSGIGSGFTNEEYKAEMEDVFNPDQYLQTADAIKEVTAATQEKAIATQSDLDALVQLKNENLDVLRVNKELRAEYQAVASELGAAINSGITPTQDLIDRQEALRAKIADVGVEAYGNSTFPDMTAAMMTSQAQSQALTAEMAAMQAQIKGLGAEYEATDKQIQEKQKTVRDINEDIRNQQALLRTAAEAEKEGIRTVITQMQNKKGEIQNEISDLQELSRDQKEARKVEQDALKESIQQIKEKQKAVDELAKNTQRTAELRAKQQQEEAKAADDLYREQQKQAADSIKWVSDLDDATKKRILGEQDAVKVLQKQGVTLTDLQALEVRRMQGAYKTEQAYEAQAKALEKQLGTSATLAENMSSLGNALSNIGGALNIEGLGDIGEGLSALPDAFKNIKDSFSGLKDGLAGMKNGFSGFLDGITSITGAVSALMSAWKIGESIFEGIKSLFKDTKSRGTEAAEAFQKFVASNIEGGDAMAAALKRNFHAMGAAGFDFQKFLQQTGTTMDQTFGGISQNWQTGATAMDIFTRAVGRATGDMQKAPQVALQMMASFQDMGLSAEEAGAKMLEIAEAAGMSQAEIEALKAALEEASASETGLSAAAAQLSTSLTQVTADGQVTSAAAAQLSTSLAQVTADGQVTSAEIGSFVAQLQAAGVPTAELSSNLLQLAQNAGMTPAQIQALSAALSEATGSAAALDDELVGHSLVPSLQMLSESASGNTTPLTALGAAAAQAATQTATASTQVDALKAALAGGGEEGVSTTAVFDGATAAAQTLAETAQNLTGDVQTLTGTLAGAGSEGGDTTKIFTDASDAAKQLDSDSQTLSGDVSTLTQQLSGAGAETLATSNLFTMAGGSAAGLQGDVNNLDSQVATANASLAATQKALADIPNEKTVTFRVVTVGSVPRMATGGTIGASGLAIVNERGNEIAQFPGGGMALMTSPGATLGAFPVGTEIIPHGRAMDILSQFPGIPRMATGGTVGAMVAPVINITITGNTIANNVDIKNIAKQVSAEISRNYNARR